MADHKELVLRAIQAWASAHKPPLPPSVIAKKLGISHACWTNWLARRGVPAVQHKRIGVFLGRTVDEMYRGDATESSLQSASIPPVPADRRLADVIEMWPEIEEPWRDQIRDTAARGFKVKTGRPSEGVRRRPRKNRRNQNSPTQP